LDDAVAAATEGQLLLPVLNGLSALLLHPRLVSRWVLCLLCLLLLCEYLW
jgi:hypothetical protein